ncbi:hypothetical protein ACQEVZ_39890 [Dactylosporangium sp. CA-152071]|uniref:hypothetical protein n=1 Tax=Dactylosporangium sp. CA-152071 TaxID=3239933 RepID=UPI003D94F450
MAAAADVLRELCADGRIMPMPSGVYLHIGPMTRDPDPATLQYAMTAKPRDGFARIVVPPGGLGSGLLERYLGRLLPAVAERVVLDVGDPLQLPSQEEAERYAERHGVPIELPTRAVQHAASPRLAAVDEGGLPTFVPLAKRLWVLPAVPEGGARQTPYGLAPGARAGTYNLGGGWVAEAGRTWLWLRPDGAGNAPPATKNGPPTVYIGVPGVETPPRIASFVNRLPGAARPVWLGSMPPAEFGGLHDGTADDLAIVSMSALTGELPSVGGEYSELPGQTLRAGDRVFGHVFAGPAGSRALDAAHAQGLSWVRGFFVVVLHGAGARVRVGNRLYTAGQFNDLLDRARGAAGADLLLLDCAVDAGRGLTSFASRLAEIRNRRVVAASGMLGVIGDRWYSGVIPGLDHDDPRVTAGRAPFYEYRPGAEPRRLVADLAGSLQRLADSPTRLAEPEVGLSGMVEAARRMLTDAGASLEIAVAGGDVVRFTRGGRVRTVEVDLTRGGWDTASDEDARRLIGLGAQALARPQGRLSRFRTVLSARSRPDRLTPAGATVVHHSVTPADRGRLYLAELAVTTWQRAPADRRADAELGLAAALRQLGALRDTTGGFQRGEKVLRGLSFAVLTAPSREVLLRIMWSARTVLGDTEVLDAVDRAAMSFAVRHQDVVSAVELVRPRGGAPALRLTTPGAQDADVATLPVRLVPPQRWGGADRAVVLRSGTLEVRADASDAAIAVSLAGELHAWAVAHLDPAAAEPLLHAWRLLGQHRTVLHLAFQRGRFRRAAHRARSAMTPYAADPAEVALHTVERDIRRLLVGAGAQLLAPAVAKQLGDALHRRRAERVEEPLPGHAPTTLHMTRRVTAATAQAVLTYGVATLAGRDTALTATSIGTSMSQAASQAHADGLAAASGGAGPATRVLARPGPPRATGSFRPPTIGLPKAALQKRGESAVVSALAGMIVGGAVSGRPEVGAMALGLNLTQSIVTGAGGEWVAEWRESVARRRFEHLYEASPDGLRNRFLEALNYHVFGAAEQLTRTGRPLTAQERTAAEGAAGQLRAMRGALEQEVGIHLKELRARRRFALAKAGSAARRAVRRHGGPAGDSAVSQPVTYDVFARGFPRAAPRHRVNVLRVGAQDPGLQIPTLALAHLLNSVPWLADSTMIAATLRAVGYGFGRSYVKRPEFTDRVALASVDALWWLTSAITALEAMLGGLPVVTPRAADPARRPWLRRISERTALAADQAALHKERKRPTQVPLRREIYKHLPSGAGQAAGLGIAIGAGLLAGPPGWALLGGGIGVSLLTFLGEAVLRNLEPMSAHAARDREARQEVRLLPWTVDERLIVVDALATQAATFQAKVTPVPVPGGQGTRRLGGGLGRRLYHGIVRVSIRIADLAHRDGGRILSRAPVPAARGLRLTPQDRAALDRLHQLLNDLALAESGTATARGDLDADRLRAEVAVLVDELGLRDEQPETERRWTLVRPHMWRRHHRDLGPEIAVARARRVRLGAPPAAGARERAAYEAIRDSRAGQPETERLWKAAARVWDSTGFRVRVDVRSATTLEVSTGATPFTLTLAEGRLPHGRRGELRLADDDLLHALPGRAPRDPHTLTVTVAALADTAILADLVEQAAHVVDLERPASRRRHLLWSGGMPPTRALNAPQDAANWPMVLPHGVAERDWLHLVGADAAASRPWWDRANELAAARGVPVVVFGTAGSPTVLAALLERFRWRRERPVVVTQGPATRALVALTAAHGLALVHQATPSAGALGGRQPALRLGNVWAVHRPDGTTTPLGDAFTDHLFDAATAAAQPVTTQPPVALADWLTAPDWPQSQRLLTDHLSTLLAPATRLFLAELAGRAAPGDQSGVLHEAILDLAAQGDAGFAFEYLTADRDTRHATYQKALLQPALLAPLSRLVQAADRGDADRADVAILQALHKVMNESATSTAAFDADAMKCLSGSDRVAWSDLLRPLRDPTGAGGATVMQALATLIMTC